MARQPRLAVPGQCHLVLQRALSGAVAFADDVDRQAYLVALTEAARLHRLKIYAWGLGEREVWLLVEPETADGLSLAMQAVGRRYVAGFNRRHGRRGTLWDGRFRAGVVADEQVLEAMVLVEAAGSMASMSATLSGHGAGPGSIAASTRAHHLGQAVHPLVSVHSAYWSLGNTPFEREAAYRGRVQTGVPVALRTAFERAVLRGSVTGPAAFVQAISLQTGRPVQTRPRGRPRAAPS